MLLGPERSLNENEGPIFLRTVAMLNLLVIRRSP